MTSNSLQTACGLWLLAASALPLGAQLSAPNDAGVAMGHLHFNVRDVEAHKRFWTALGGADVSTPRFQIVRFPGLLVLLRPVTPSGGTEGSVIQHVGFRVKNLQESLAKWRAAGLTTVPGGSPRQAFVTGPDGVRIEMTEDPSLAVPVASHHIHFYTASSSETQAWYSRHFGARPGKRGNFDAADLPGINLTFSVAPRALVPTKGRVLDHIGFEVKDLEAFCRKLEADGVKLDVPRRTLTDAPLSIAFLTDPWGTYIELTEGLGRY
jgi:catechol 2,3-dioxygenase-like lactoylglutathione lyase family enzyme